MLTASQRFSAFVMDVLRRLLCLFLLGLSLASAQAGSGPRASAPVDANTADEATLRTLPGVGPATAARFLEARKAGPFKDLDDVQARVKGVGPAKLAAMQAAGLFVSGGAGRAAAPAAPTETARRVGSGELRERLPVVQALPREASGASARARGDAPTGRPLAGS